MAKIGKTQYLAVAAILASAPAAACVHKDTVLDCHIEGTKYLQSDLSDTELCARFVGHLGKKNDGVASLNITINDRGIDVRLVTKSGKPVEMGIDIMDRGVRMKDLDSLAQSVGELLQ